MTNATTTDRRAHPEAALAEVLDWTTKHCPNAPYVPVPRELFEAIQSQQAEIERLQSTIAWANNSLFGSHNFFLSLNGGPPDEHHLDHPIEDLKSRTNKEWIRAEALQEALKDVLAHLVAANSLLSRVPKTAAPSDTMFDQMLLDYAKSIERGRAALSQPKESGHE